MLCFIDPPKKPTKKQLAGKIFHIYEYTICFIFLYAVSKAIEDEAMKEGRIRIR